VDESAGSKRAGWWRSVLVVACVLVAAPSVIVVHDLYRSWSVDPHGDFGALCERDDGSVWRDPWMGCGHWEDPRCRYDEVCPDSTMITELVVPTGSWVFGKDRRLTGPEP
jgi:hypothetical protein